MIIGAGVIGAAIARDLAGTRNSVALMDSRDDIGSGTTKANTAILHTGYDAKPGTLEARLVARGYHLLKKYCAKTNLGVRETGGILVAGRPRHARSLHGFKELAEANGYYETSLLSAQEVYELVPSLGDGVTGGLNVPGEAVIDPWSVPLAFATEAVSRGAELLRSRRVVRVDVGSTTTLYTNQGPVTTRWVINAAGLGADGVDKMFG